RWGGVSEAEPEQTAILRSCVVRPERTSSYSSVLIGASARWLQIAASESDIAGLTWRTQWGQRLAIQFQQQSSRIFCGDIDGVLRRKGAALSCDHAAFEDLAAVGRYADRGFLACFDFEFEFSGLGSRGFGRRSECRRACASILRGSARCGSFRLASHGKGRRGRVALPSGLPECFVVPAPAYPACSQQNDQTERPRHEKAGRAGFWRLPRRRRPHKSHDLEILLAHRP